MHRPDSCGLRGRKRAATRRALGAAAMQLVTERGLQVTVEEIAERAGVSTRTFFNYFSTKEEAITVGHDAMAASFVAALAARPAEESVWESLRVVTKEALGAFRDADTSWLAEARLADANPTVLAQVLLHQHHQEMQLADAIAARPGVAALPSGSARMAAALWTGAIKVAIDGWIEHPVAYDLADRIDAVFALLSPLDLSLASR
jgi:AcrR family transcriptional regulator